jgi:hypothetical protein
MGPDLARRIITYLWVQKINQPQIEVARHFLSEYKHIEATCEKDEVKKNPRKKEAPIRYNL